MMTPAGKLPAPEGYVRMLTAAELAAYRGRAPAAIFEAGDVPYCRSLLQYARAATVRGTDACRGRGRSHWEQLLRLVEG